MRLCSLMISICWFVHHTPIGTPTVPKHPPPVSPSRPKEVSGNRQGCADNTVSPSRDVWDRLGSALPDREPFPPHQILFTPIPILSSNPQNHHTHFPLTLTLRPDSLGSKVNTAASHQTKFRSLESIGRLNSDSPRNQAVGMWL